MSMDWARADMNPDDPQSQGNAGSPPVVRQGLGEGFPRVDGRCPACSSHSLFLGSGGFVTCARLDCPDPSAAADLLAEGGR
jgi:hypothetical protein